MTFNTELWNGGVAVPPEAKDISRSVRFNSSDSAYLSRTPASAGNRRTLTWAGWIKIVRVGAFTEGLINAGISSNVFLDSLYLSSGKVSYQLYNSGTYNLIWSTDAILRDTGAWMHVCASIDTTQASTANVFKVYLNGVEQSISFTAIGGSYTQNVQTQFNLNGVLHDIGRYNQSTYASIYLADIHFIDGQALAPTSFGFTDTNGIWQPIEYTGTYGTNGFHLPFSDNSTAAALGTDTSGNGNDWTVNNIATGSSQLNTVTAPTYSSYFASTTTENNASQVVENAFDGNLTTAWRANIYNQNWDVNVWTAPTAFTNVTSLRINLIWDAGALAPTNEALLRIDGVDVTRGNTSIPGVAVQGWIDLTDKLTGNTFQEFQTRAQSNSTSAPRIFAIEVNGAILVDSAATDTFVDVPTNGTETDTGVGGEVRGNYATLNPLVNSSYASLSDGNLKLTTPSSGRGTSFSTIAVSSGKFYCEIEFNDGSSASARIGVIRSDNNYTETSNFTDETNAIGYLSASGGIVEAGVTLSTQSTYSTGDIIGMALNMDDGEIEFFKNGVSQGTYNRSILDSGSYYFVVADSSNSNNAIFIANFGQRPFAYTAPSGYKALNTANLDAPVVTKPSEYMDVVTYTGNGSSRSITGLDFNPDLVWIKSRSNTWYHNLFDVIRGATKGLSSNATDAERTLSNDLTAFNSDGFSLGAGLDTNENNSTYVAWIWDAGSSTVTNTDGSITGGAQVRANPSAGFSIVTFTGTGSAATVGHGLGVTPSVYLIKKRSGTSDWVWFTTAIDGSVDFLYLNGTAAKTNAGAGYSTAPTSSVFSLGAASQSINDNGGTYVAYCFAPVDGYSSFGSYTGNGSADGPFVYTGFRPRWILVKATSIGTENWILWDSARNAYNASSNFLRVNKSNAEGTTIPVDILSNGFKLRFNEGTNQSGVSYIYVAFSEAPFQYARAR